LCTINTLRSSRTLSSISTLRTLGSIRTLGTLRTLGSISTLRTLSTVSTGVAGVVSIVVGLSCAVWVIGAHAVTLRST
jgi:hypothetical protein